jgi:hypothetical protein
MTNEEQETALDDDIGQLNPCSRVLENLVVVRLLKKFSAFYGTRRFIAHFQKKPPLVPILSQMNLIHIIIF